MPDTFPESEGKWNLGAIELDQLRVALHILIDILADDVHVLA